MRKTKRTKPTKRALKRLGLAEFAALMAFLISITALSIDIILPVKTEIGLEMGITNENTTQLVITSLFLGLAIGQLIYGPVSDTIGRKPAMAYGFGVFIAGTLLCLFAHSFHALLIGRFLQGLGSAAPRIISMSMIRDLYDGREMAKVTSIIMGFFILVPAIAPALGQFIVNFAPWRAIFAVLLTQAILVGSWLLFRQPETLHPEYRRAFNLAQLRKNTAEVLSTKVSFWYTIAAGLIFGAFISYIVTSEQLFKDLFGIDEAFPYYFGALAIMIGCASIFNASLVEKFGMRKLCQFSLVIQISLSAIFFVIALCQGGQLSLAMFMVWALSAFFMMGFLFGNFNAIALSPLGHIAGIGAAIVGSISTFLSMGIGAIIGLLYNQSVLPMIGGFAVLGVLSLTIMKLVDRNEA
ncbi:MAG: multidrug effflux MFS transporter [Robiginitomaculum sp.]